MHRRFKGGFFALRVRGVLFGGAYIRNFTVIILACPGFEPAHLCDPSDQMRPIVVISHSSSFSVFQINVGLGGTSVRAILSEPKFLGCIFI